MPRYPHITIACKAVQPWAVIELYRAACAHRRHGNPDILLYSYFIYKLFMLIY